MSRRLSGRDVRRQHVITEYLDEEHCVRGISYASNGICKLGFGFAALIGHILIEVFDGTTRLARYFVKQGFRIIGFGATRAVLVEEFDVDVGPENWEEE